MPGYSLQDELEQETRRSREHQRLHFTFATHPSVSLGAVLDQKRLVEDLQSMEGDTRFMPNTRQALDTSTLTIAAIPTICFELEEHIARIRPRLPYVADHRAKRRACFCLKPTLENLRAVWLIRERPILC